MMPRRAQFCPKKTLQTIAVTTGVLYPKEEIMTKVTVYAKCGSPELYALMCEYRALGIEVEVIYERGGDDDA